MAVAEKRARSSSSSLSPCLIPEDIVIDEILKRHPVKSLVRFKSVCKLWRCSIQDPYFVDLHYKHSHHHRPQLVITLPCNTFPAIDYMYPRHVLSVDPETEGACVNLFSFITVEIILSCFNGLILYTARDRDRSRVVCNPITKQSMTLPDLSCDFVDPPLHQQFISSFEIGYDRSTHQHKVLHIRQLVQSSPQGDSYLLYDHDCDIITLGGEGWRKLHQLPPHLLNRTWTAYANGAVHWRNMKQPLADDPPEEEVIVAFDFTSEKFRAIPLPYFTFSNKTRRRNRLVQVMETHVGLIDLDQLQDNNIVDLWILQDYTRSIWVRQSFSLSLDMLQDGCMPDCVLSTQQVIMKPHKGGTHTFTLYYHDLLKKTSKKVELTCLPSQEFCPGVRSGSQVKVNKFVESLHSWNGSNHQVIQHHFPGESVAHAW